MLSQCANPACAHPLTTLAEGRLFQFEIVSISVSATDENKQDFDETPSRETALFWLCTECAATMTLTLEPLAGLRLLPLEPPMPPMPKQVPLPKGLHDC